MGNRYSVIIASAIVMLSVVGISHAAVEKADLAEPLSIDQAVKMALRDNAAVREAHDEVAAARAQIGESRSQSFPELIGESAYTHLTNVPVFNLGPGETIALAAHDDVISTITLRQSVYTGGRITGNISRAEALYDAAVGSLGVTQNEVGLQTRQAYYAVLLDQALVRSAEATLTAAQKQLTDATSRYDAGTSARYDVLRAKTQVSQAQQTLVEAQNQVEIAEVALNRILGVSLERRYTLSDPAQPAAEKDEISTLIETAVRQRAEILSAHARVAAAELGIKIARSGRYPQVDVSASYQDITVETPSLVPGYAIMATVSEEIFDGGRIHSSIQEAKSRRDEAKVQLDDTIRMVEQETRQSFLNLETARKTEETAKDTLAQAQEAFDVATVRYQAGVGTATEIADALASLTSARTNLDNAQYGYSVAYATLQRALGKTTY
jgi:TolC family type I secretion outer membrane protein